MPKYQAYAKKEKKNSVVNLVNTFKQTFEPNDFSMTLSSWWVAGWGGGKRELTGCQEDSSLFINRFP